MAMQAQLHDGRVLEFPDGTDPSVIQSTVKRLLGVFSGQSGIGSEAATRGLKDPARLPLNEFGSPIASYLFQPEERPAQPASLSGAGSEAAARAPTDPARMSLMDDGTPLASSVFQSAPSPAQAAYDQGLKDPLLGGAQLATRGVEALAPAGSGLEGAARGYRRGVEQDIRAADERFKDATTGQKVARSIGTGMATAPLSLVAPGGVTGAALVGGATAALSPVNPDDPSFFSAKAKETGKGAVIGGATGAALKVLSSAISPRQELQDFVAAGGRPTPGQAMGGAARRIEEGLTSVPVAGDIIKNAQRRSVESFDRAAINKTLAPLGEKLDDATPTGREAVAEMGRKVSDAYNALLPKLTVKADSEFVGEITKLNQLAKFLPPDQAKQFDSIIGQKLLGRFGGQTAKMSGETLKEVESELGSEATAYLGSSVTAERKLGGALKEAQATLRRLVARSNPAYADELQAINSAYAMAQRVEDAAGRIGSKEGVFSPSALVSAARTGDKSLRHKAFARGDALLQPFAEGAESVIGPRVPDSGTPFRLLATQSLPSAMTIAGLTPALLPYTPAGQRLLGLLAATRPEGAQTVGNAVRALTPAAGAFAPPLIGAIR